MAKKVLRTNLNPTELWSKVKKVVRNHEKLSSITNKIRLNESQREAILSHMGIDARIAVKGVNEGTIEIEVDAGFPASFFVDEEEIISSVEQELRRYV